METLLTEFRQALRRLLREWGFTLAFVLTLALGIGANGGMFAALNAYLFKPLPYPHSGRLMLVQNHWRKTGWSMPPPYLGFSKISGISASGRVKSGTATAIVSGTPRSVWAAQVNPSLFPTLGVRPFLGRWADSQAGKIGGPREIVLSFAFWQDAFGGDPKALGRTLKVNSHSYVIVGVMPADFSSPTPKQAAFWTSLQTPTPGSHPLDMSGGNAIVRLTRNANVKRVRLALNMRLQQLLSNASPAQRKQAEQSGWQITATPLRHWLGATQADELLLMQAGAFVLLLLAAANLGNLALVRVLRRQHDMALRLALGARPWNLLRMAIVEAVPLGLCAGALGFMLARLAAVALSSFGIAAADTPYKIVFSGPIVLVVFALALAIAIAATSVPLLLIRSRHLDQLLQQGSVHGGGSRKALRMRQFLSVSQIALAVLLLSGAALIGLSLHMMVEHDPGFKTSQLVVAHLNPHGPAYGSKTQKRHVWRALQRAAAGLPGVQSAGVGMGVPFTGYSYEETFQRPNASPSAERVVAPTMTAGAGLLRTLHVRLLAGRLLKPTDIKNGANVIVVDRQFAQALFNTTNVLGRKLNQGPRIIGVIADINDQFAWNGLKGTVIRPPGKDRPQNLSLIVRSPLALAVINRELRTMLKRVMPDESFTKIASMQQYIRHSAQGTSAVGLILAACGIIALMLASTGTYGVIAQLSRIRRREFAIRIALGATPAQIEWLVLRTGLALWIIGSATGVGLAIAGGLMFRDHLYKVSALDPGPYIACAVIIGLIVLLASWFPARLTSRMDPSEVLQSE